MLSLLRVFFSRLLKKRDAFGLWKHTGKDALEYQRKLRSEWDR